MNSLSELKTLINTNTTVKEGLIFVGNCYIAHQYIQALSRINNKPVSYTQNLNEVKVSPSIFGHIESDTSLVYRTKELNTLVKLNEYCYIICDFYVGDNAIVIPKVEPWHIIDYINSNSKLGEEISKKLATDCNYDLVLIDNELTKINIFNETLQIPLYKQLYEENQISRNYTETVFDFTQAILNHDKEVLYKIYSNLTEYDIEPLGVVTILYKQLRNLIMVGFNKNPTEENTGLSSKQLYFLKKNLNKYSSSVILKSFQFVCELEKLLKEGTITNNQLVDYIVVNLL